ncbi:hypothetical protein GCM10025862_04670 [Arsenicicoccus piscis]|uniref:Methyltransferase n=1 Tax=Arsenicicoccus piscis TaxID=673954 RepID=A0ABQ6HIT8_9MICO|nr:hypothetical protein GCM10025862_04670 [Arsenicicoccus piscis]
MLAAAVQAKAVVEIGTGAGVSGLWLLEGMAAEGVLTTIDIETSHTRSARSAFLAAKVPHQRTRLITGRALDVLPRLTDGAYDLVLVDGDKVEYPRYVEEGLRLLRPGAAGARQHAVARPGRRPRGARRDDHGPAHARQVAA